jgi:hypothetical protein
MQAIRKIMAILLLGTSLLAFAAEAEIVAQDGGKWWVNVGAGAGQGHDFAGFATGLISFNYQLSAHQLITARAMQTSEFLGQSSFTDVGLLYGVIAKQKYAYISASVGLGLAQYAQYSGGFLIRSEHIGTYNTLGIPAEIQVFATPTPYAGFGVILFGNANTRKSIAGLALAVQIGDLG